jgi:hypothetical protein
MTLVVIALDAADLHLVEQFDCDNILLNESTRMESVAHRLDHPHTGEAWPSIATGLHPTEHGITGHGSWDNPILTLLSRTAHRLNVSGDIRGRLGDAIKSNTDQEWHLDVVDEPTFLDGEFRAVHNWPGVYRNESIHYIWDLFQKLKDDDLSEATFTREAYTEAASKFGWVHEALRHETEVVATHVHLLDVFGHLYPDDEDRYGEFYADVDGMVGDVRDALGPDDELLILSDHGMETSWIPGDENPGTHSWRAIATTTLESPPTDALDVKSWVEANLEPVDADRGDIDVPEDQLRELGYIQ